MIKQTDQKVREQHTSWRSGDKHEEKRAETLSNVVYNPLASIPRLKVVYLSPEQWQLFRDKSLRLMIIKGGAGTGKSMLCLFKVLELVRTHTGLFIIIFAAPYPQNIRCKKFLQENNVAVKESAQFPPEANTIDEIPVVYIYELHHLAKELLPANPSWTPPISIFVDDVQSLYGNGEKEGYIKWSRIQRLFSDVCLQVDQDVRSYAWMCLDKFQHCEKEARTFRPWMDPGKAFDGTQLDFNRMPGTYEIHAIMRNASPIGEVLLTDLQHLRDIYQCQLGHNINGPLVDRYVLIHSNTRDQSHLDIVQAMSDTLRTTLDIYSDADVALLHDDADFLSTTIWTDVLEVLKINPISIEDYIYLRDQNKRQIVADKVEHVASFECPIVIVIITNPGASPASRYSMSSRARSKLTRVELWHESSDCRRHIDRVKQKYPNVNMHVVNVDTHKKRKVSHSKDSTGITEKAR